MIGFTLVVPSPFGPACDCPNPKSFEEALARASKEAAVEGPATIYLNGEPIVFLAGTPARR